MARLSISDLNNLSGNTENNLNKLYRYFRNAHTSLYNKLNKWLTMYEKTVSTLDKYSDYRRYKKVQELYYEGNMLLDSVTLFEEYTKEYSSVLYYLNKSDNDVRALLYVIRKKKKEVIDKISDCYVMYNEAYNQVYEWED